MAEATIGQSDNPNFKFAVRDSSGKLISYTDSETQARSIKKRADSKARQAAFKAGQTQRAEPAAQPQQASTQFAAQRAEPQTVEAQTASAFQTSGSQVPAETQQRQFGYSQTPDDVGKYQKTTMQHTGTFDDIQGTGQYVIADMVKNGKVLSQRIYDPNGRFVKAVNPNATGTNNIGQRDVVEELKEVQSIRHGNQQQRVAAAEADLQEKLAFYSNTTTGRVDPQWLNRSLRNDVATVISAKSGVTGDELRAAMDAVPPTQDARNLLAIAGSDRPLDALRTATALYYASGKYTPTKDASRLNLSNTPHMTTSNGYYVAYVADTEMTEDGEKKEEGIAGRLVLTDVNGTVITTLGSRPQNILSNLNAFGVGNIQGDFTQFLQQNPVLNPKVFPNAAESNQRLADAFSSYQGYQTPFEGDAGNQFINLDLFEYLPGGSKYDATRQTLAQIQQQAEAARAAERETTLTQPMPTTQAPTVAPPTTPTAPTPTAPPTVTPPTTTPQTGITTPSGITPPQVTGTGTFPTTTPDITTTFPQVPTQTQYTGTAGAVAPELLTPTGAQQAPSYGVRTVNYTNQFGTTVPVVEVNGQPTTFVPPGYTRQAGAAEGGMMQGGSMFTPQQSASILGRMFGYRGPADERSIQQFLAANPAAAARMGKYQETMKKMSAGRTPSEMNTGGMVRGYQPGGLVGSTLDSPSAAEREADNQQLAESTGGGTNILGNLQQQPTATQFTDLQQAQQNLLSQAAQPLQQALVNPIMPTVGQFIPSDTGQTAAAAPFAEAATVGTVEQAQMPTVTPATLMQAATATPQVQAAAGQLQAAQGQVAPEAQVTAQTQNQSAVSQIEAAQGTAYMMTNPVQREIQQGELISGSTVDATKVAELNSMTQAATATPSQQATVQGQLEGLMQQFEGGATPAWAAGAMRNAQATLAARGVGASSMAGQAIIQAAMESALPIAQADAATRAQFESQNLSNRQQAAMLAAQQRAQFLQIEFDQNFQSRVQNAARIADVANMNFTAEQQVALENSRAANTMNLTNLSNSQAMVMAEAAALANLDMANLNNRQQAAVQNAQNFLQMDMTNLNNRQQTELFKSQQVIQALFTDQAAENAAAQFNATSDNQVKQFFAQLQSQTSQFNAAQKNAIDQFNAGETNALREFNSTIQQQRDLFNAQNGLVIAQANAQWRQNLDTLNTAAQNEANMEFARTLNALSAGSLDNYWQKERDVMSMAWQASESAADRANAIVLQKIAGDATLDAVKLESELKGKTAFGEFVAELGGALSNILPKI